MHIITSLFEQSVKCGNKSFPAPLCEPFWSDEQLAAAREILAGKGVSYINISPSPENSFYKDFVADIFTFPTTYIVDREGNMIGAPLAGNVKGQLDAVESRLELILNEK